MAKGTYFELAEFVDPIEKTEFENWISWATTVEGIKDIWSLLGQSTTSFGALIETSAETVFKEFWPTWKQQAEAQIAAFTPGDPDKPTPEEQIRIDALIPEFLAVFPSAKAQALRMALENVRPKSGNDWRMLEAASSLAEVDARDKQDTAFYESLAAYYMTMAARYATARSVRYDFLGRVLDGNNSSAPKPDVRVSCADLSFVVARNFGITSTNREGYYRIGFTVLEGIETTYNLRFTFTHEELSAPVEQTLTFSPVSKLPVPVTLAFVPLPSTSKTIASTGVAVPADVQAYLASQSITITRLEDIRRLGALKNLPPKSVDTGNADLLKLDGLASLEVLQDDVTKNAALYDRGYTGITQIANTPRSSFVEENSDLLGEYGSAQLQFQARAAHLHALNQLAGGLTAVPELSGEEQPKQLASGCNCPDCTSAVSPLAYLADLLAFATSNVKEDDDANETYQNVSLEYLKGKFFHEFAALREECEQLKGTICQNRIAAEILRAYHGTIGSPNPAALLNDERDYLFKAYELLLSKLGTSYVEIRKIRGSIGTEESDGLTDRMGIISEDGSSTLDQLFIDASDPANLLEGSTSEPKNLESLFGLRDSRRPLLDTTPISKVETWKAARLRELWAEQDRLKNAFWNHEEVILDPDVVTADDFRSPQTSDPAFAIWKDRREWVDELVPIVIETYDVPKVDHRAADNTLVLYGAGSAPAVTLGDHVTYVNGGAPPFNYTAVSSRVVGDDFEITVAEDLERDMGGGTITVNSTMVNNATATRSFDAPDLDALLTFMRDGHSTYDPTSTTIEPNWPETGNAALIGNIRNRVGAVRAGNEGAVDDLRTTLNLEPAELYFLDEFLGTYKGYPAVVNAENNHPPAKWDELRSILVNVMKRLIHAAWITEEVDEGIALDPESFWKPVKEPGVGAWPPLTSTTPLLDPDLVGHAELPELTVRSLSGLDALAVLEANRADLDAIRGSMLGAYQVGFMELVNYGFNAAYTWNSDPVTDLQTILNSYYSATDSGAAVTLITDTLRISVEEFLFLMDMGTRRFSGAEVPQRDIERTINILSAARKRIVMYPLWVSAEGAATNYWKLLKARLPKWRATMDRRRAWLSALEENSSRPIIDADLIGPGDLLDPTAGNAAFDLYEARRAQMETWQAAIGDPNSPGFLATLAGFDTALADTITYAEPNLAALRDEQEAGTDIRPRLQQLTLSGAAFNQLLVYRDILAVGGNSLTKEEKTNVQCILAHVKKRRQFLANKEQEMAAGITQSQDYFRIREVYVGTVPLEVEFELKPWLAEERDLILWRRLLKGRIEQEKSVLDAWHQALFEVDEVMMVHLRDALVKACGNAGEHPIKAARRLGDRLLTDLENNCCFKTNRVAAAIETMQQFLWKLHTGDLTTSVPRVKYIGEDFEEAWTWMGSYANWRAAMFVFLYPENVLIPSLRKHQTPAFEEVVSATRGNRRFSPADACDVAHAYREYLEDVSDLRLSCAVEADVFQGKSGCSSPHNAMARRTLSFAVARGTGRSYFTMLDTQGFLNTSQTNFWERIEGIPEGAELKGADYYRNDGEGVNHVYVFYLLPKEEDTHKFYALRFDVNIAKWESEPIDFEVAADDLTNLYPTPTEPLIAGDFDTRIAAFVVLRNNPIGESPWIAISLMYKRTGHYQTFKRRLNTKGTELASKETWDRWDTIFKGETGALYWTPDGLDGKVIDFCAIHSETGIWTDTLFFFALEKGPSLFQANRPLTGLVRYRLGANTSTDALLNSLSPTGLITNLLVDGTKRKLGLLMNYGDISTQIPDTVVMIKEGIYIPLESIAFKWTNVTKTMLQNVCPVIRIDSNLEAPFIYQRRNESRILVSSASTNELLGMSWTNPDTDITPLFTEVPSIGPFQTHADLVARRENSTTSWLDNEIPNFRLIEYVQEAFYFVPLQIAMQLHANGHYAEALKWFRTIYDFRQPVGLRKIHFGLKREETSAVNTQRALDWFADPLNPHGIASLRRHTYTRYTILAIVNCLLDYADSEFTTDTSETVPRARELYEDALALLNLIAPPETCPGDAAVTLLKSMTDLGPWESTWEDLLQRMEPLSTGGGFAELVENIGDVLQESVPMQARLASARSLIEAQLATIEHRTLDDVLNEFEAKVNAEAAEALGSTEADQVLTAVGYGSGTGFDHTMEVVTGRSAIDLTGETFEWFIDPSAASDLERDAEIDLIYPGKTGNLVKLYVEHPGVAFTLNSPLSNIWLSGVPFSFCVVPNPIVGALVMKAEVNLFKIHNCMNIAGMVRELDPFAAPTDSTSGIPVIGIGGSFSIPTDRSIPPSAYRYRTIVDRAKQLVAMAQQVESAFLSALEKFDAESYSQLRAEQDIESSKANIKLQDLKIKEANSGVKLAELQRDRAQIQVSGLNEMINDGLLGSEHELLRLNTLLAVAQSTASIAEVLYRGSRFAAEIAGAGGGATFAASVAAAGAAATPGIIALTVQKVAELTAIGLTAAIQNTSIWASFERRKQEWEFQLSLGNQDIKIGEQQIALAQDRVRITGQEREIASIQYDHAKATLDFLKNKFTSADLYEWMSRVLEDIYSWFLQEATSTSIMAQRQLAFERQVDLPPFIRNDYWIVDGGSTGGVSLTGEGAVDRRGITGSSRLLKDLYDLDQYAFSTNSPKLQMSKTISLTEIAPEELMRLREKGVMSFRTTQEMFDRDYPGHYLRMIKKVNVTVIALNPPSKGIRATLTNGGVSRVITGGTIFQERVINRLPEQIALSGGVSDYGVFQLRGEGEFLDPFEGTGVDTQWEFRMEKAANPFDYNSIADVLVTIEYEAMSSFTYRNMVVQRLNQEDPSAALAISLKNNLPDQWFDLHNPEGSATPYAVSFAINSRDIVPNMSDPAISGISLFIAMKDGRTFNGIVRLGILNPDGTLGPQQTAQPNDNFVASSVFASFPANTSPVGTWTFGIDQGTSHFVNEEVEDILVVMRYTGFGTHYSI